MRGTAPGVASPGFRVTVDRKDYEAYHATIGGEKSDAISLNIILGGLVAANPA